MASFCVEVLVSLPAPYEVCGARRSTRVRGIRRSEVSFSIAQRVPGVLEPIPSVWFHLSLSYRSCSPPVDHAGAITLVHPTTLVIGRLDPAN
jgi:hypothetical protein